MMPSGISPKPVELIPLMRRRDVVIYALAFLVAAAVIGLGVWFVHDTESAMARRFAAFKSELKTRQAAGELPAQWRGVDIERLEQSQVGMQVDSRMMMRLDVANFLSEYGFIASALVVAVCLVMAMVVNWLWK